MSQAGWRLLVVDDNDDNRYTLTRRLRREGYTDIVTAEDGAEALGVLRAHRIDLVLLDIMMPDTNGYQVLEHMRGDPELRHVPVIMISAVEELDSVVRCIELGAEDYLAKPFNPTLLRARVGATLEKKRLRDEARASLRRLEFELASARKLQLGMLPRHCPAWTREQPVELAALMEPAREVGGDLYDFFALPPRILCFLVGDVADKGAAAAMFMARARSLVRMAAEVWQQAHRAPPTPSSMAEVVNRELCRDNEERMFVTLFLGFLDMQTGVVVHTSAGHPLPYVVPASGGLSRLDGKPVAALGVRAGTGYADRATTLAPGDALFVFSDGVTEARNGADELYGDQRLEQALGACGATIPSAIVAAVKADIDAFSPPGPKADDVTMLCLRWRPAP